MILKVHLDYIIKRLSEFKSDYVGCIFWNNLVAVILDGEQDAIVDEISTLIYGT